MDYQTITHYLGPPVLGAFIGYLTNDIAIRMLFRPLRAWRILGVRIPMTPGVIPAKRQQLAENMGQMVGTHLLTSKDIGESLSHEHFQEHLRIIIANMVEDIFSRELGTPLTIMPRRFRPHFRLALRTLKHRLRATVHAQVHSDELAELVRGFLREQLATMATKELNTFCSPPQRATIYAVIEDFVLKLLDEPQLKQWLATYVLRRTEEAAAAGRTIADLLPDSLLELIFAVITERSPTILQQLAKMLAEPPVRERIIHTIRQGVDNFIASLGPFGAIAAFFDLGVLEKKIREYLDEKQESIVTWLQNPEVRERLTVVLEEQMDKFLHTPIAELLARVDGERLEKMSAELATQLLAVMRAKGVTTALALLFRENMEKTLGYGEEPLERVAARIFPGESGTGLQHALVKEAVAMLRSEQVGEVLDRMINSLVDGLTARPLGVLGDVVPPELRRGITDYLLLTTNRMLLTQVPGIIDSLNIRRIVADKVNSLDLLKVEQLLLSIMEEQFKYINLFGALLGFLLGLINLFLPRLG